MIFGQHIHIVEFILVRSDRSQICMYTALLLSPFVDEIVPFWGSRLLIFLGILVFIKLANSLDLSGIISI